LVAWGRAEYVEAYEAGASIDDIALIAGKASSTVRYHLVKAGVRLRPQGKTSKSAEVVHEGEGHALNERGECVPCKSKQAKDRYNNDPEFRERRLASSRKWKQNRKKAQNA
jgi:hypothetical protein